MKRLNLESLTNLSLTTKKSPNKMFAIHRPASEPGPGFNVLSPRSTKDELAGRIVDANNYHNTVLVTIFRQAIEGLAQNGCAFDTAVQERVWERIKPIPFSALRTVLIQEVRTKLFLDVGDDELRVMLDEHEKMGQILQDHRIFYVNVQRASESIFAKVQAEAHAMTPRIMGSLINAIHEELTNVLLPGRQRP